MSYLFLLAPIVIWWAFWRNWAGGTSLLFYSNFETFAVAFNMMPGFPGRLGVPAGSISTFSGSELGRWAFIGGTTTSRNGSSILSPSVVCYSRWMHKCSNHRYGREILCTSACNGHFLCNHLSSASSCGVPWHCSFTWWRGRLDSAFEEVRLTISIIKRSTFLFK